MGRWGDGERIRKRFTNCPFTQHPIPSSKTKIPIAWDGGSHRLMSILLEYRVCAVLQVTNGGDLQLARSGERTLIAKNSPPFYAVGKGGDPNGLSSSKICLRTWPSSIRKISPQSKFKKNPRFLRPEVFIRVHLPILFSQSTRVPSGRNGKKSRWRRGCPGSKGRVKKSNNLKSKISNRRPSW